jgi:tRNA modification GTPase
VNFAEFCDARFFPNFTVVFRARNKLAQFMRFQPLNTLASSNDVGRDLVQKLPLNVLIHEHLKIFQETRWIRRYLQNLTKFDKITKLSKIQQDLANIRKQAAQGALLREGLTVVIAGRPNAGKSPLMNCLAQRDTAIVTEVPGTTRDVLREHILLDDIPIHLLDTAGLRSSDDVVEQEGIKRAWAELSRADCVILLMDCSVKEQYEELILEIKLALPDQVPIILVYNKVDKIGKSASKEGTAVYVSLKNQEGLTLLKDEIKAVVGYQPQEGQFLARRRHLEALDQAMHWLHQGAELLISQQAGELLAEDLRLAHAALGEITGEFTADDLLGEIFSRFCIGK